MMLIAATCASLCGTSCISNIHDAVISGTTSFFYDTLNQVATDLINTIQPSSQGN